MKRFIHLYFLSVIKRNTLMMSVEKLSNMIKNFLVERDWFEKAFVEVAIYFRLKKLQSFCFA